ncbi:MAG: glycine cleavage system aminomethyltransferase GcvT [Alphaproteobacteria bacterium]|nr:glycine cleavage system aminomethyltransferase GcvT [Alphaproteobacteria bacterium]
MAQSDDLETLNPRSVPLAAIHVALRGRMVPFAGYALPVQYRTGIVAEHNWTRQHAGLFDVSHMGPSFVGLTDPSGEPEADHAAIAALIEPLVCGDIAGLKPGQIRYTLLLNDAGGTRDDLMIARPSRAEGAGWLYVVVNAGTKEADFAHIAGALGDRAMLRRLDDNVLLALQGPEAVAVMNGIVPGVAELGFMHYRPFDWRGEELIVSRSGYTGEDGFEILVSPERAAEFWQALTADERVRPIGLGARDSLRLEAALPLYGHELDETISPVEAGLDFALSKARRTRADFPGATRILSELAHGPSRIRVGLLVEGAPAREGAEILDADGHVVGIVTSGGFSPTLQRAVALGLVPPALSAPGQVLGVALRGRVQKAIVTELPFVPHNYFRKPR